MRKRRMVVSQLQPVDRPSRYQPLALPLTQEVGRGFEKDLYRSLAQAKTQGEHWIQHLGNRLLDETVGHHHSELAPY
ncbi:hypothetical protein J2Z65_004801 [Paenibacillus aceris]|uniref:Uncharacterized protein n=1 Tax=Paenibacillus aceris TaxID=869555 RepID=A0ABS4I574_9BACL|nr:hypothetical protein [Paenibacillus aceris]